MPSLVFLCLWPRRFAAGGCRQSRETYSDAGRKQ